MRTHEYQMLFLVSLVCWVLLATVNVFAEDLDWSVIQLELDGDWSQACISGNITGWSSGSNGLLYDLASGNRTLLDIQPRDIYGELIVCQNTSSIITIYNITDHTTHNVGSAGKLNKDPSIDGFLVVYTGRKDDNDNIYLYNISSNEEIQITNTSSASETYPDISGDYIVYRKEEGGIWSVYLFNISDSSETVIATYQYSNCYPVIYGEIVVWNFLYEGGNYVYFYNISSGQSDNIGLYSLGTIITAISEDIIVCRVNHPWGGGETNIYGYNLSSSNIVNIDHRGMTDDRFELSRHSINEGKIVYSYIEEEYIAISNSLLFSNFTIETDEQDYGKGEIVNVKGGFISHVKSDNVILNVSISQVGVNDPIQVIFLETLNLTNGQIIDFIDLNGGEPLKWNTGDYIGSYQIHVKIILTDNYYLNITKLSDQFSVYTSISFCVLDTNALTYNLSETINIIGSITTNGEVQDAFVEIDVVRASDYGHVTNLVSNNIVQFIEHTPQTLKQINYGFDLIWNTNNAGDYRIKVTVSDGTPEILGHTSYSDAFTVKITSNDHEEKEWVIIPLEFAEDIEFTGGYYSDPCIFDNYIGFSNYSYGVLYDLTSGYLTELIIFPRDIYKELVVCQNTSSTIAIYNITDQSSYNVGSTDKSNKQPSIDGLRVVYTGTKNGNNDIYMYDLSSHEEIQITNTSFASETYPDISGDYITFRKEEGGIWHISLFNLTSREETILASYQNFNIPAIDGDLVAWVFRMGDIDHLYTYNITSELMAPISLGNIWTYLSTAAVSDSLVSWLLGVDDFSYIHAYDFEIGQEYNLPGDRSMSFNAHSIHEGKIVWSYQGHGTAPRLEFLAIYDFLSNFTINTDKLQYEKGEQINISGGFTFNRVPVSGARLRISCGGQQIFNESISVVEGQRIHFSDLNDGVPFTWNTTAVGSYTISAILSIESPYNLVFSKESSSFTVSPSVSLCSVVTDYDFYDIEDTIIVSGNITANEDVSNASVIVDILYTRNHSLVANLVTNSFVDFTEGIPQTLKMINYGFDVLWAPENPGEYVVKVLISGGSPALFSYSEFSEILTIDRNYYEWPMFRHDSTHTGYVKTEGPDTNNTLWSYTFDHAVSYSSPAVADGRVYVGSWDNHVYCLDANDGTHIWNFTTGDIVQSSPAVNDGKVYIGSYDDNIYCLDATNGTLIWSYTTGYNVYSSPVVYYGKVYIGSYDNKLYCLDADDGSHIWNYTTGGWVKPSPSIYHGKVYVGSYDNNIYCLDAENGTLIWSYTTGGRVISSPSIVNNRVYVGSWDNKVYCLDAYDGSHIWNFTTGDGVYSSPAVAHGRVYVASYDYHIYCLDTETGTQLWNYSSGPYLWITSPAVADDKVYAGSDDSKVYCFDAIDGSLVWDYQVGSYVQSSPAVVDGRVYIGSWDRKLYCFGAQAKLLDLLVRGNNDRIYYNVWDGVDSWNGWVNIPGATNDRPAGAILGTDLHFIVRGKTGGMFHSWLDLATKAFSGWSKLSGDTPSAPVLTASDDKLYLVVRGLNSKIYYREYDGAWSGWYNVPGATIQSPAATVVGDLMHLVVVGSNGRLFIGYVMLGSHTWSGWTKITGATPSQPVLCDDESSIYLVVRGNNNKVYLKEYSGSWGAWTGLPGATGLSPGAAVLGEELHLVVKGLTGGLYHGSYDLTESTWNGWDKLSGDTPSAPTLTAD